MTAPVLDPSAWAELQALDPDGQQGLMGRLVDAFGRTLARQLAELDAALDAGPDLARLARAAHTLKSACGNLAALQLSAQWQVLEQQCKEGRREGVEARVAALKVDLGTLHEALRRST